MNFSIVVMGSPYSSQSVETAYRFAEAALENEHTIFRVFFYHDGVYCANQLSVAPQDEINIPDQWQQLTQKNNIDVVVCIASATKRGILNKEEAQRHGKQQFNLISGFELSGLGQLVDACVQSDKVITFAG